MSFSQNIVFRRICSTRRLFAFNKFVASESLCLLLSGGKGSLRKDDAFYPQFLSWGPVQLPPKAMRVLLLPTVGTVPLSLKALKCSNPNYNTGLFQRERERKQTNTMKTPVKQRNPISSSWGKKQNKKKELK